MFQPFVNHGSYHGGQVITLLRNWERSWLQPI
jgi:uncharacterized damage-inducible protein DinB